MFTIIGGDGNEYGPVPASQVRAWISGGRASLQTKAKKLGMDDWKTLNDFPEFSPDAPVTPPAPGAAEPVPAGEPVNHAALADDLVARAGKLYVGECLGRGWELWLKHFWQIVLASLLFFAVSMAFAFVPFGSLIFGGVLSAGLFHYALRLLHDGDALISDLFAGFSEALGPLILAGIVVSLLTMVGIICLILPGIYLAIAWTLTYPLVLEKKLPFWTAMEVSRRVISRNWWRMLLLMIVAVLLSMLGVVALVIGVFLTMPIGICVLACAYDSLFNPSAKA